MDAGLSMLDIFNEMGLKYRFGTVPMNTSPGDMNRWVEFERSNLAEAGIKVSKVDAAMFHVPFVWAVIDVSGR